MLTNLVILGLASATISTTIGSSKLFKGLRQRVAGRSEFLGDLFSCPYCLGHYIAATLVALTSHGDVVGLMTTWLAVTAISALISGLIGRLHGD